MAQVGGVKSGRARTINYMLNYREVEEVPDCLRCLKGGSSVTPCLR